jgi:precorrin-3B methylase
MEIMKTLTSSLTKVYGSAAFLLCAASGAFASDLTLQKVPDVTVEKAAANLKQNLGPQATFALINYSNTHKPRPHLVSRPRTALPPR